ncbi:hypothetical protein Ahy_A05g025320 [Arachis hypogaea]|uniref:NAF domain-containing protein n=1 Tax=Arachis hypogaea TaxID=3818 RepID=A0A445D8C6_ARAHY|nr:hypothetical protein Ahy_A05g025320 [Arachis hypogaea]
MQTTNPPVRANVLYISPKFSLPIVMFHASHHIQPVPATKEEIEAEASSVQAVARTLCPLKIVLDIVVLTSTGVLLSCWQENLVTERKEKSVSMNAFELISRSQSFNLDSFFEQQTVSFLFLIRVTAITFCVTLAASLAARQGSKSMAAFQVCLQIWLAVSLLADGLVVAGQVDTSLFT